MPSATPGSSARAGSPAGCLLPPRAASAGFLPKPPVLLLEVGQHALSALHTVSVCVQMFLCLNGDDATIAGGSRGRGDGPGRAEDGESCVAGWAWTWTCTRCAKRVRAQSVRQLGRMRVGHLAAHVSMKRSAACAPASSSAGPEPLVWTLFCDMRVEAATGARNTAKRTSHLASRHPGYAHGVNLQRQVVDVVEASDKIPLEQRAWTCAWCNEGLPDLPRSQLGKSVRAHLKKKHGRRRTTAAASNKPRGKIFRRNKNLLPVMRAGKAQLAKKLKQRADGQRDWQEGGHDLREVEKLDWQSWHGNRTGAGGFTLLTCCRCLNVLRAGHVIRKCRGNRMWERMSPANQDALLQVWGMAREQADSLFGAAKAAWRASDNKGRDLLEVRGASAYVTCRKCWFVRIGLGHVGKCHGRRDYPWPAGGSWRRFGEDLGLQRKLARAWGVTLQRAQTWYSQDRPTGRRPRKRPAASKHSVASSWKKDVVEDATLDLHHACV